jgi:hypothetical protein
MVFLGPVAGKVILWTRCYKLGNILMEIMSPAGQSSQTEVADLDILVRIICNRIGDRFTPELERKGFHRSIDIFSRGTVSTCPPSPPSIDTSAVISETKQSDALALLTLDVAHLLYRRLSIDQERQGHFSGRLSW